MTDRRTGERAPPRPGVTRLADSGLGGGDELSSLRGLLAVSMLMTERGDEEEIVSLLAATAPTIARCRLAGLYDLESGWKPVGNGGAIDPHSVSDQISALDPTGGALLIGTAAWARALPLGNLGGVFAFAVVTADGEPPPADQFLLEVLTHQTGIAMANARLHEQQRRVAVELRTANATLAETLAELERSTAIHDRLTEIAVAGGGQQAIASAVHVLTSYPVVIEDRHGNLRASAGPSPPDPYPKSTPRARSAMLRRAAQAGKPIRDGDRVVAVASPQDDLLGVLALVDPAGTAGSREQTALEHGATVLAMELARLRAVAETELRLGRDLADDLLAGADGDRSLARAQGLGYDLQRVHRVVVVSTDPGRDREPDDLFDSVRRVARDLSVGSLVVARGATVVVLSDAERPWEQLRALVDGMLGSGHCRVGVGGQCMRPSDFPRSYREAQLALDVQIAAHGGEQATEFDKLGVFRILVESGELSGISRFVDRWLGSLIVYDDHHGTELVETLRQYLEHGGGYEATALALSTHRNTLKYRLQRIRAISGLDLVDADARFNLQLATRALSTLNALESHT